MKEITLYANYAEQIELLSNNQCGVLFRALMDYANGKDVPAMDTLTSMAFLFIKGNIDREEAEIKSDEENARLRSQWGKMGGRPKKVQKGTFPEEKGTFSSEKVGFSEKKVAFDTFSQKEYPQSEKESEKERSKEKEKEKEYNSQEKDIPPYNPPTEDETVEGYLEFMREHAYIIEDLDNPSELYGIDFALLSQKIAESSRYLQGKQSLKWLLRHYREIIGDSYKDFARPPLPRNDGKGDLQLWQELVKALKAAKEERYCETVGRGSPIHLRLDGAADEEMKVIYRSLSPEIMAYFDPQSFLELCEMSDADLKFERARFLKALPEIRRKREGNDGVG